MKSYNIDLYRLAEKYGLGRLTEKPIPICGGLLHRMFDVKTESGRYAVKALNPNVTERDGAVENYIFSERAAQRLSETLRVSFANVYGGKQLLQEDGQYYLVYDFIDGSAVPQDNITEEHSRKIGEALAKIHSSDFSDLEIPRESNDDINVFNADFFLSRGSSEEWYGALEKYAEKLVLLSEKANNAVHKVCSEQIVCHRDIDAKNVLWQDGCPIIIDWESAGLMNPYRDVMDTDLYWSQNSDMSVDSKRFFAFYEGYTSIRKLGTVNWKSVLYCGLCGKFGWLEYNLRRSLGIECADEEERRLGNKQSILTINEIISYAENISEILKLTDMFK